jgi:hypothetical protein
MRPVADFGFLTALWLLPACAFGQGSPANVSRGDARLIRQGNDYLVGAINRSSVPMSAYSIEIVMYGSGQRIRHFYDARMVGRPPIRPGGGMQEGHPGIIVGAVLLAAVFTDGTSFGDGKQVGDLMERRVARLRALTETAALLCETQGKGAGLQAAVDTLEERRRSLQSTGSAMMSSIETAQFTAIINEVKRAGAEGADPVAAALRSIEASGAPLLLDPVKDPSGQLYIKSTADQLTCRAALGASGAARPGAAATSPKATSSHAAGTIETLVGIGLRHPVSISIDSAGNVFIADDTVHSVLRVAGGTGEISRVAGLGKAPNSLKSGDGGPALEATLFSPLAATPDATGNLYIADGDGAIRKVAQTGTIISIIRAQNSAQNRFGFSREAIPIATRSAFDPSGLALDAGGNLYIADLYNECVRRFAVAAQTLTTVAGNCELGAAGGGYAGDGGPATNAKLAGPSGLAVDAAGNLYIADSGNQRIRRVAIGTGVITTIAGTGRPGFEGDGVAAGNAQLNQPAAVAVDGGGNVFIADRLNHRVRKIAAKTGVITTVAGTGSADYGGDGGPAARALLNEPGGVALDSAGNLYIADTGNSRVRRVIGAGSAH